MKGKEKGEGGEAEDFHLFIIGVTKTSSHFLNCN